MSDLDNTLERTWVSLGESPKGSKKVPDTAQEIFNQIADALDEKDDSIAASRCGNSEDGQMYALVTFIDPATDTTYGLSVAWSNGGLQELGVCKRS